jgi:hypothetical protein
LPAQRLQQEQYLRQKQRAQRGESHCVSRDFVQRRGQGRCGAGATVTVETVEGRVGVVEPFVELFSVVLRDIS